MSVEAQRVWVTEDALNRMRIELAGLVTQRSAGDVTDGAPERPGTDATMTGWEQRERRIRQLRELIRSAVVREAPDDGVAEPGMVVTVRYGGTDSLTETFLLADRETADDGEFEICSPRSPLGRALLGAVQGEEREYRVPGGGKMTVTLVRAVAYRGEPMTSGPGSPGTRVAGRGRQPT